MTDFITRQIRTYVPYVVGLAFSWLVAQGIIDAETSKEAAAAITGGLVLVAGSVYYFVVSWLAERFPWVGYFLVVNAKPTYPAIEKK